MLKWVTVQFALAGVAAMLAAGDGPPAPGHPLQVTFDELPPGPYVQQQAKAEWPGLQWFSLEARARIVAAEDDAAQRYLEVKYPAGKIGPGESGGQFLVNLPPREEYWLSYSVKFDPGFDFRKGGKLPGLCGGGSKSTGGHNHPGEAWSARYMFKGGGQVCVYLYHLDQKGKYGDSVALPGCTFEPGRWHRLTQHLKVNTNLDHNGVLEVWFDGQKVIERTDLRLRAGDRAPVDTFYFSTFHGGATQDWAPLNDSYACFDEFVLSTSESEALDPTR